MRRAAGAPATTAPSRPAPDPYERLSPVEAAVSWAFGTVPSSLPAAIPDGARRALEREVLRALTAGPTFILFSGGRDSSAVLAVATHVARREGLPPPTPVTAVFPGVSEADETAWQALVLDHLGITDRILVRVATEQRWLGEAARRSLTARGLVWPPALHLNDLLLREVSGGQLLTGEGGDEVLGIRRITPANLLVRVRATPRRRIAAAAARAAVPWRVRALALLARAGVWPESPWLRGAAARAAARAEADAIHSPWNWAAATRAMLARRAPAVLEHNYAQVAREHRVDLHHPLRAPAFVAALAKDGGFWGYQGRTHLMRVLFADLLPDALLARPTKTFFDETRFGEEEREFARAWTGAGVDPELVDPDALREHWLGDSPHSTTAMLLHQAWLASQSDASRN